MASMVLVIAKPNRPRGRAQDSRTGVHVVGAIALAIGILITCSGFSGPAAPVTQPPIDSTLLPVSHWRQLFDHDSAHLDNNSVLLSHSSDSWDFYPLAYSIDSFTAMYEATGQSDYLDRALSYVDGMVSSAQPSASLPSSGFHDGYLGWVSERAGDNHNEVPLYESYAWRYVTRMLRVIRQGPLYNDPSYRAHYERLLQFSETNIFDKWYTRGANFIYRSRTHMAAHWAYIAHDLAILTSDEQRRARYSAVVNNIDYHMPNYKSSLHGQLRAAPNDPDAYWWSDIWGETDGPGQDIAHGNGVVSYVVEAHDSNGGWTDADMAHFCRTLTTEAIGTEGNYPQYVDGSGSGNGWLADGFVKLGRYDERLQRQLQVHGVQNGQFYAAMAENAKILAESVGK